MREYESLLQNCLEVIWYLFEMDERECFTLSTCLVNVFTELLVHINGESVKGSWTLTYLLGESKDSDFCISELKHRFAYKVVSISFLKRE
ncbi:hypothetical protein L873DRAFT_912236 [Choiromyces venosus 120613-1]|uniref:Uncharacterized protein n=1 Tax=Choiromyces venosus 120613-1 TaxID=1336337 RepID=A0A3N4JMN2_9PEZI|nr:hypothetical protein L873DRAFT_912236 [Choiromyces venosus 120613-1]